MTTSSGSKALLVSSLVLLLVFLGAGASACAQDGVPAGGGLATAEAPSLAEASSNPTLRAGESTSKAASFDGESSSKAPPPSTPADSDDAPAAISASALVAVSSTNKVEQGVDWPHLFASSAAFLAVSHSFRYATEATTRRQFHKPLLPSYFASVENLHGWADGDPFMVNYVGHPMEGAVAGFIWQHNDRAYRTVEFGRNRRYWKARLRGMAFAYVYSVQFEIGPISEASIGHIQSFYPQVGFVDHVITPTVGLGWNIAEDAVDRKIIQPLEAKFSNPWLRMALRMGLNPSRTMANAMSFEKPWHRDDRPGVFQPFPEISEWAAINARQLQSKPVDPPPGVAPFDFTFHAVYRDYLQNAGSGGCMGGGGTGAFRVASEWQIVLDVGGCKMLGFKDNWSGDALTYMVGPRWTPQVSGRWIPHLQAMVGGTKLTQEFLNTTLEAQVAGWHTVNDEGRAAKHDYYNVDWDTAGFLMQAGAGVDYKLNSALALTVGNLEYSHAWTNDINGFNYRNAIQFTSGLVLHMGTW